MHTTIELACGEYDITRALMLDEVDTGRLNLAVHSLPGPDRHGPMISSLRFDVCEIPFVRYLATRLKPKKNPFTAIPVYPHKRFRHSYYFKNTDSDIDDPGDLEGKNVGVNFWRNDAGVWLRGIAREHYDLDLEQVTWYVDKRKDLPSYPSTKFEKKDIPQGKDMEEMLVAGELDVAMKSSLLKVFRDGHPNVERVFDDPVQVEKDYYESTGIFPIMHVVVVRDELLDASPNLALDLLSIFRRARDIGLEKMEDPRHSGLLWAHHYLREQQGVVGNNPWPYGLGDDNRRVLNKVQEYAVDQEIIPQAYPMDELFAASTLETVEPERTDRYERRRV